MNKVDICLETFSFNSQGDELQLVFFTVDYSAVFMNGNVKQNFLEALQHKGMLYLAGIGAIHLGLAIGLKLYFFLY